MKKGVKMPMEAGITGEMVGAPSGSSTGIMGFHVEGMPKFNIGPGEKDNVCIDLLI